MIEYDNAMIKMIERQVERLDNTVTKLTLEMAKLQKNNSDDT